MGNPAASFRKGYLYSPGNVFTVGQPEYDENYIITHIDFVRELFNYQNEVSTIEIKLKKGVDADKAKEKIKTILGNGFYVEDRYEQQAELYKIMNVEKLISFIFLTFILLVASLNVIGSIAMLIIEKRDNIKTIQNLGASRKSILNIFLYEGWLISMMGAAIGITLGVILCLIQQHFGLISLGTGNIYMTEAYPVRVNIYDIIIIFITVLITVLITIWLPTKILSKRLLK